MKNKSAKRIIGFLIDVLTMVFTSDRKPSECDSITKQIQYFLIIKIRSLLRLIIRMMWHVLESI